MSYKIEHDTLIIEGETFQQGTVRVIDARGRATIVRDCEFPLNGPPSASFTLTPLTVINVKQADQ